MTILTKGEITEAALKELSYRGCEVWRQNNISVRGRKFTGKKGLSDIQGYQKCTGVAIYCEIKTINDRFSDDQIEFLTRAQDAGCFVLIARQTKQKQFEIVDFKYLQPIETVLKITT